MSGDLRTDVWYGMVDTDRLARYYGELAGKLANREKRMTVATTVLAMVSVGVATSGDVLWTVLATLLTVAASVVPLVYRVGGVVTSATYCQNRLGDLAVEWEDLWSQVDTLSVEEVRTRWHELAKQKNAVTALMSSGKMDRKLRDSTEDQAYEYWKLQAERARVALPAV